MSGGGDDAPDPNRFTLRLFIAGTSSRSQRTVANLRALCAAHLHGRVELEIVDIYRHPELAESDQIVAAPTLLKLRPLPVRRIVGDLSDLPRALRALGLPSREDGP